MLDCKDWLPSENCHLRSVTIASEGDMINQLIEAIKCMSDDMRQQCKVVNDNGSGVKRELATNHYRWREDDGMRIVYLQS